MPRDPFVEAAALGSLGPVRYLDARDPAAFDTGHAPGAVRVPLESWDAAVKAGQTGAENVNFWNDAFRALGLGGTATAVAYDGGTMTNAARVWFILQFFGLEATILNGGWGALAATGSVPAAAPASTAGVQAVAGAGAVGLVDRHALKQQLGGRAHVFDSRTHKEFTGEDTRGRARSGHLPGARHLSHADLMRNGIVHPAPMLRGMMEQVGFGPGDHIVTHCEGGGRAALAAAAAQRAGFDEVRVYYLSFADWARDESCPIVRV